MVESVLDRFVNDVSGHKMWIIRDDGLYRHVRFHRLDSNCMYFDLITWPGCLCYTGDMGTFVFRRLEDMFQFFRRTGDRKYDIDFRYWAEKVESVDRDGVSEYSEGRFQERVKEWFDNYEIEDEIKSVEVWQAITDRVLSRAEDEHEAFAALHEFEHGRFNFCDWECDCKVWTHRFLWCCYALVWAIGVYDESKELNRIPS